MGFMEPQIEFGEWVRIETRMGDTVVPLDVCDDLQHEAVLQFTECHDVNDILDVKVAEGWGARLSAPGYMDCTEWAVFQTESEAIEYLEEMYGDDE